MSIESGVQDELAPLGSCFGCGPANPRGLKLKSRWAGEDFVATFRPEPHHRAFPGVLSGGIVGTLLDCHGNWCAATTLMRRGGKLPATVTAEFHVKLRRPTPMDRDLTLHARPVQVDADRVVVEAELRAGETITATCRGVFVSVGPGHPAYHHWD